MWCVCITGAESFHVTACPEGHYCPAMTERADEFPCPKGTFYNSTGARNVSDCLPCTLGSYCETEGLSQPTGLCDAGK